MEKLMIFASLLILHFLRTDAQITAVPVCESTGHRCISLAQCATLPDAQYQWCGSCNYNVRCQGGAAELFEPFNPPYIEWDDNKKNYELLSTTCTHCYYPCPPGPSAPQQPVCEKTGLGCITACPGGQNGNFQFCGNCSHYINCVGFNANYLTCPDGTFYDDFHRTCQPAPSPTCRECYGPCSEPTTEPPTTELPTTEPGTTDPEPTTNLSGNPENGDGESTGEDGATTISNSASTLASATALASNGVAHFLFISMFSFLYALVL